MALCDIHGKPIAVAGGGAFTQRVIENPNLADPSKFTIGLIGSNGVVNTAQVGCNTSDFIPVTPGKILTLGFIKDFNHNPWFYATRWAERCPEYVFFADDKTTVITYGSVGLTANGADGLEVPEGAAYIRASWTFEGGGYYFYPNETPEMCFVHMADTPTIEPMYWFADNVEKTYIPVESVGYTYQPPYLGKKWVLFGDSLTDAYAGKGWDAESTNTGGAGWTPDNTYVAWTGQLWGSRIASELGLTIDNRAKSGSNINDGTNGNYTDVSGIRILDTYIAEVEAGTTECADYITVGFGSNTRTDQIGTNADTSDTKTSVYAHSSTGTESKAHNKSLYYSTFSPHIQLKGPKKCHRKT